MANWLNPTNSSQYTTLLDELKARDTDVAKMFSDFSGSTSGLPTSAVKWDSTANKWKKWNGTAWEDLTATYAINISGTSSNITGTVAVANGGTGQSSALVQYGVIFANTSTAMSTTAAGTADYPLIANSSAPPSFKKLNLSTAVSSKLPIANGGTNADSAAAARTNLEVPKSDGTGASGSWAIDITGNAATATSATSASSAGSAGYATSAGSAPQLINVGGWSVKPNGTFLEFSYNNTVYMRLTNTGSMEFI